MVASRKRVNAVANPSSFMKRAATTFTVGPLALFLIYLGGYFYFVPLLLIISLATYEYATLLRAIRIRVPLWLLLPSVWLQLIAGQWPELQLSPPLMVVSLLAVMAYALWSYEKQRTDSAPAEWVATMAGILLLGWVAGHFFRLRQIGGPDLDAVKWTTLALVSTWFADSAAYLIGSWRGKHKLARRLSPNKTIEGYVAGIVLGTGTTLVLGQLLGLPWTLVLLVGMLISVVSPAGDLGISLFKREAGVKDSGNMLPGHGGALDRVDSLIWSVTMAYYVVHYLG
jgi:phosphatidate cytidylyltransferase